MADRAADRAGDAVEAINRLRRRAGENLKVVYANDMDGGFHGSRETAFAPAMSGRHPELVSPSNPVPMRTSSTRVSTRPSTARRWHTCSTSATWKRSGWPARRPSSASLHGTGRPRQGSGYPTAASQPLLEVIEMAEISTVEKLAEVTGLAQLRER